MALMGPSAVQAVRRDAFRRRRGRVVVVVGVVVTADGTDTADSGSITADGSRSGVAPGVVTADAAVTADSDRVTADGGRIGGGDGVRADSDSVTADSDAVTADSE